LKKHIKSIKEKASKHKTLIQNFSYLSALQIFNMLIPLITYPYLIRVLGKETYGLVIFAQAIIYYFVIWVGFGFNISATKEVSIHRDNKEKLSEVISSVFIIKGILFLSAFLILTILLHFIPKAHGYKLLFYATMWMALYDLIFPIWYFQGIERMKYITIITLLSRLTFLSLIFILIHSPNDYLLIPIINGIGALLAGITALYIVFNIHKNIFKLQPISTLKYYIVDSFPIFVSNLSTTLYLTSNKVILGAFLGMGEVAYYDLAEKLSTFLKTPIQLIGQTIYPKIAKSRDQTFIKKSFFYTLAIAGTILIIGMVSANEVISILGGKNMQVSGTIFRILLISIIPVSVSMFYANIALISWGYNKEYFKVRIYANGLYLAGITMLYICQVLSIYSVSFLSVFIEFFASYLSIYFSVRKSINFLIISKQTKRY